jgi:hypothetical protein
MLVSAASGRRSGFLVSISVLTALLLTSAAEAQTVYCGPGTAVESENGGGPARIEEIGTEAPHVGWYRVSFTWSPRGEWYNPATWKLYPTGTKKICSPKQPASAPPQLELPARPAPILQPTRSTPSSRPFDDDEPAIKGAPQPRPSSAPPSGGGSLPAGRYVCSMPSAGQFPITIVDGSTYTDRAGQSGRYGVNGTQVTFESGSLRGQFSRILGPGKFGLSTDQNRMFYGVCNLKR